MKRVFQVFQLIAVTKFSSYAASHADEALTAAQNYSWRGPPRYAVSARSQLLATHTANQECPNSIEAVAAALVENRCIEGERVEQIIDRSMIWRAS
jgi:hypothetical protein